MTGGRPCWLWHSWKPLKDKYGSSIHRHIETPHVPGVVLVRRETLYVCARARCGAERYLARWDERLAGVVYEYRKPGVFAIDLGIQERAKRSSKSA